VNKRYISPSELLRDSYGLAWQVFDSEYRPDYLIGIWRGGTPVAIAMHELLHLLGLRPDHLAIRSASYTGIAQRQQQVSVDGLEYLQERLKPGDRLLLVDDVHDTGLSLQQVIEDLEKICAPGALEIRLATPWFKPGNNQTGRVPDYLVHESNDWLVFPHELEGLAPEELAGHKPELAPLLEKLLPHLD
jgi:hypoxanthine phosphoribosyltransferase